MRTAGFKFETTYRLDPTLSTKVLQERQDAP